MADLTERMIDFYKESNIVEGVVKAIDFVMTELAKAAVFLSQAFTEVTEAITFVGAAASRLANADFAGIGDQWVASQERVKAALIENSRLMDELNGKAMTVDRTGKGDLETPKEAAPKMPSGSGGGLSKTSTEQQPFSIAPSQEPGTYFTDRLQNIRDQFSSERELLTQEYELNQQVLDNALLNERIKKEEHTSLMEQLEREHQNKLRNIRLTAIQENLGHAADFMGSMVQIAELGGKKTTKIAKVFGIAQALISTFQGAAKALTLPFPANMAAYAQVLAQGLTAVASIKKVSENGGSNGAVSGGGRGGAVSGGAAAAGGGGCGGGPTTTFQFTLMNDPMGFGEKFARQFIDQLNSTQRNGGTIRGVIA